MEALSNVQQGVNSGYFYERKPAGDPAGSSTNVSARTSGQKGQDSVTLSREGQEQSLRKGSSQSTADLDPTEGGGKAELDLQELEQLQQLKLRDKEVRTHEQAHLSAAGQYARGGMSFSYQKGPDGASYAVGGEVGIDLGEEPTPEATLLKMQTVRRAALAPADPSGADRQIAAVAAAKEAQARQEIQRKNQEEVLQAVTDDRQDGEEPETSSPAEPVPRAASSYASLKSAIAAYTRAAEV